MKSQSLKLKRFALALALFATLIAATAWLAVSNSPHFTLAVSRTCKLTIRYDNALNDEATLYVTFHYPPAIGTYGVSRIQLRRPRSVFDFKSVKAEDSPIQCIYDANGSGFVFLYNHKQDDSWVIGQATGYGNFPTLWSDRFNDVKSRFPEIPYDELPTLGQ